MVKSLLGAWRVLDIIAFQRREQCTNALQKEPDVLQIVEDGLSFKKIESKGDWILIEFENCLFRTWKHKDELGSREDSTTEEEEVDNDEVCHPCWRKQLFGYLPYSDWNRLFQMRLLSEYLHDKDVNLMYIKFTRHVDFYFNYVECTTISSWNDVPAWPFQSIIHLSLKPIFNMLPLWMELGQTIYILLACVTHYTVMASVIACNISQILQPQWMAKLLSRTHQMQQWQAVLLECPEHLECPDHFKRYSSKKISEIHAVMASDAAIAFTRSGFEKWCIIFVQRWKRRMLFSTTSTS